METVSFSETSVNFCWTAQKMPEDSFYSHFCENLILSRKVSVCIQLNVDLNACTGAGGLSAEAVSASDAPIPCCEAHGCPVHGHIGVPVFCTSDDTHGG